MRYSQSFYLDLLGFLTNTFDDLYWGENKDGYYWGVRETIFLDNFSSLQELIDSISIFLKIG